MGKTVTKKVEKKETKLEQVFAMWKETSKAGKTYFSGKTSEGNVKGFYNKEKKNPKEPDIRIYLTNGDGELEKEVYLALWCNATEKGKKYLSGKLDGQRVVGFINEKASKENKQPYFTVYYSDDKLEAKQEKLQEVKEDEDLPF